MSSEVMFSIEILKDGTIRVQYEEKGSLKIYRLRPRNPALIFLPLFSTLGLTRLKCDWKVDLKQFWPEKTSV